MPLFETPYPQLMNTINSPSSDQPVHLVFYSSVDPSSKKMWCPDCRDVEGIIKETYSPSTAPKAIIYWVGQRSEWRDSNNEARKVWNVNNVPTVLRLENGKETGRLVESQITRQALEDFTKKA